MNEAIPADAQAPQFVVKSDAVALCAAYWLGLAATPTFAIMALFTAVVGSMPPDIICSGAEHTSPLSGMIPMYLLMSTFHSPPWLKLISRRDQNEARAVLRMEGGMYGRSRNDGTGHGVRPPACGRRGKNA